MIYGHPPTVVIREGMQTDESFFQEIVRPGVRDDDPH
jgi:hypothetical protein